MNEKERFDNWFKNIILILKNNIDAGFPILMICFPLLERYLREKTGIYEANNLTGNYQFSSEMRRIFPEINNNSDSEISEFWKRFRHGLLHQCFFTVKDQTDVLLINNDYHVLDIKSVPGGGFTINVSPNKFADRVLKTIENDFQTFIGGGSQNHPMSKVYY